MLTGTIKAGTRVSFNGTDSYVWTNLSKSVNGSDDAYGIVEETIRSDNDLVPVVVRTRKGDRQLKLTGSRATFFLRNMLELE